jgi:Flp pilus assembly protein TadD
LTRALALSSASCDPRSAIRVSRIAISPLEQEFDWPSATRGRITVEMPKSASGEVDRIRREVERALHENLDAEEVLPLLAALARLAEAGSAHWLFAHRHLAEIGVEHDPWRAALFARRVLACAPEDDGAWAVLGLAMSLLGHHRFASHAYERALALVPENPWYAHNLGHLYDVLDRPQQALPLLARAVRAQPGEADIAASYAHALARTGQLAQAKRVMKQAIRRGGTADQMALWRWLEAGAPARWPRGGGARETTVSEPVSATVPPVASRDGAAPTDPPEGDPAPGKARRRRARRMS